MTTLYRKYRPKTFEDVVGQKHIVTTLENSLRLGRIGQAYLFTGPRGTGKTTLARIFAKAVNCLDRGKKNAEPCGKCVHCVLMEEGRSMDIFEIDAASHTGVDNIRELRETIVLPPSVGSHKIYIIDEVHMLSTGAFNALLKTLEEPPSHALFILATTALHKVPDTIISRCQRFDLGRFPVATIVEKLTKITKAEKITITKEALGMIAIAAEGGMRDAESLLTQISSLGTKSITEDDIIEMLGTAKRESYGELLLSLGQANLFASLEQIRTLSQDGRDLAVFLTGFIHFLRDLLLFTATPTPPVTLIPHLTEEDQKTLRFFAETFSPVTVVAFLEILQIAQRDSRNTVIAELPLEIALVKITQLFQKEAPTPQKPLSIPGTPAPTSEPVRLATPPTPPVTTSVTEDQGKEKTKTATQTNQESEIKRQTEEKKEDVTLEELPPQTTAENLPPSLVEFSTLTDNWTRILATAKNLNASLSLALSTASPRTLEGDTVVIAVKYAFHKERLDEPTNRLTLTEAFDTILGSKLRTKIIIDEPGQKETPSGDSLGNPLINQAMSMLGGRIAEGA